MSHTLEHSGADVTLFQPLWEVSGISSETTDVLNLDVFACSLFVIAYAQGRPTDNSTHSLHPTNYNMLSFARLLTFFASISLLGTANGQEVPVCSRTTNVSRLETCLDTVIFAIRAVLNASDNFVEGCTDLDYEQAAGDGLDLAFLQYLVCKSFGGQGQFYGNTDDAIEEMALAEVALQVAEDEPQNPALRYICIGLNLDLIRRFQLPANTIYNAACGGLFIPRPSITVSSSSVSTTSSQSTSYPTVSSFGLTTPPEYSTSTVSSPSGYTSTSCTTSSSSIAVYKRQSDDVINRYIEVINSAVWALSLIEADQDDEMCDVDDYWVDQWDELGYDGDYVQALICASAANNTLFPPRTIFQARASLITALRGIILARDAPESLARKVICDNLSYAVLAQAEFDPVDITNIIYFVCYADSSSTSSIGPALSSLSTSSTSASSTSSSSLSTSSTSISLTSSGSTLSGSTSTSSSSTSTTSSSATTTSTGSTASTPFSSFSSSSTSSSSDPSGTSTSLNSSSSSLCSYVYENGGYDYSCASTTLDTSYSTTTTLRGY